MMAAQPDSTSAAAGLNASSGDRDETACLTDLGTGQRTRQRLFIVRHGERLDNVDYSWVDTAERPYDPPITQTGVAEAKSAGERFTGKVVTVSLDNLWIWGLDQH